MPQQQATINFCGWIVKISFYLHAAETGEKANENIECFFFIFYIQPFAYGEKFIKNTAEAQDERRGCSLSPVPHKFHGNQPALQVIQTSFVATWVLGSGPGVLRSGSCRILLLAPAAEILLPLFMLSLCNILPASFSCSSSLSSLVFNILQLVKELLLKPATKRKPKSHGLLL